MDKAANILKEDSHFTDKNSHILPYSLIRES